MKIRKGFSLVDVLLVGAIVAIMAGTVIAGDVFDRVKVTIPAGGAATWTNDFIYASFKVENIYIHSDVAIIDTVTVKRVTATDSSSNRYTNNWGAIVTATSNGWLNVTNSTHYYAVKYGDMVTFQTHTGMANTGAVALIEGTVQKH